MDIKSEITELRTSGHTWNEIAKTFKSRGYKTTRGSNYSASYLSKIATDPATTRDVKPQADWSFTKRSDGGIGVSVKVVRSLLNVEGLTTDQKAQVIDSFYSDLN